MTVSFSAKEIVAHIFISVIGLTMIVILFLDTISNYEENWINLIFISSFVYMSGSIYLSFRQLVNLYNNTPAVIIDGKRIKINSYWTVKHIYWHRIKYIKMDEQQRSTIPRYIRLALITKNSIEAVKINVHLLKID